MPSKNMREDEMSPDSCRLQSLKARHAAGQPVSLSSVVMVIYYLDQAEADKLASRLQYEAEMPPILADADNPQSLATMRLSDTQRIRAEKQLKIFSIMRRMDPMAVKIPKRSLLSRIFDDPPPFWTHYARAMGLSPFDFLINFFGNLDKKLIETLCTEPVAEEIRPTPEQPAHETRIAL